MLNKGPSIRETLRFLVDVLERMQEHQHKKTARLRMLRVSEANSATRHHAAPTKSERDEPGGGTSESHDEPNAPLQSSGTGGAVVRSLSISSQPCDGPALRCAPFTNRPKPSRDRSE